jgi:hypothetical protein
LVAHKEFFQMTFIKFPVAADGDFAKFEMADAKANQPPDTVSKVFQHPADVPFAPFVQNDVQPAAAIGHAVHVYGAQGISLRLNAIEQRLPVALLKRHVNFHQVVFRDAA